MAGQTVGGPDPTGMRQAQNVDGAAKRATDAAKGLFSGVSTWREERKIKKDEKDLSRKQEAQRRLDAKAEKAKKAEESAAPAIDEKSIQGAHMTEFNRFFLDAIRRGQSRTIQASSADSIIREVICHDTFIRAIANVTVRTPLEQMDTEYGKEMGGRRQRLASQLMKAKEQKEFMIGELTAHELDIIYATMLGTSEDDAIAKTPGAVEIWKNTPWPSELPKPPEAFFMFLESIAIRERPGEKGGFIGNVLKKLSVARTFVDTGDTTLRTLVDGAFINDYLYRTSAYPIDTAVESFHSLTGTLLATPTDKTDPVLNMPGIGYEKGYAQALSEKQAWVEQARQTVAQNQVSLDQAVAAHNTAVGAVESAQKEAQKEVSRYTEYKKRTDKGEKITLQGSITLVKNDPRIATALAAVKATLEAKNEELGAATKWLDSAKAAKAKVDRELSRREAELAKFQAEASPQALARELASHFKSLLEENRDANVDFGLVGDRIAPRLPNPVLESLLAGASELVRERDEFAHVFVRSQMADTASGEEGAKGKGTTEIAHSIIGYRLPQFEKKLADFERAIEAAELPDTAEASSKEPMRGIVRGLKHFGVQSSFIDEQIGKVRNAHGQPLRKAVQISVKSLGERSYRNLAGITDAEKITARMAYEARTGDLEGRPGRSEGKWARFWQKFKYHLFTTESWVSRDMHRPGKLVKLYRWAIADDIDGLHPGNWLTRKPGRRPDGTPYKNWSPRVLDSIWGLTWKGYFIGTALVGAAITTQAFHWYNPLTWVGRPMTLGAEYAFHGGRPFYLPESQDHWYFPWSFTMPKESERQQRRVIDDNYDIPGRLAGRGAGYYRQAYGVGTHRLATEQDDSGMGRRLDWLQRHQDVLTFFQERTTLNMQVQARVVGDRPENCFTTRAPNQQVEQPVAPIVAPAGSQTAAPTAAPATGALTPPPQANAPNSCKSLGVSTAELARDYRPVDLNDNYQPGMKVCCTIQVSSRRVPDGLKLNTFMADAFIDLLMAVENGGGRVDYPYLTNAGNRGRWAREWYLVTPSEAEIITRFRINERDNVRFLLMQGAEASSLLLPRCSSDAESPEFLRNERRNEFTVAWRTEATKLMTAAMPAPAEGQPAPGPADPLTQDATREVLEQAFNTIKEQHADWFMDRTHAYERRQAAMQVQELAIQTDTALDVLVAQRDILDLAKQFGTRASYTINAGRSDEFIQVLDQHKRMGGSLDDFNPFCTVPNAGVRVQWAIQMGYIQDTVVFRGAAESQSRGTAAGPAAPGTASAGPAPIADLTQDGQRFYTNPANEPFTGFFEGVMRGAFTSRGNDGRVFQGVMASRFGGDQPRMERAIKEDMYRFLQRTSQADILGRDGIDVAGTGAAMTAVPRDMAKSRNSLLNHMRGYVTGLGRQ